MEEDVDFLRPSPERRRYEADRGVRGCGDIERRLACASVIPVPELFDPYEDAVDKCGLAGTVDRVCNSGRTPYSSLRSSKSCAVDERRICTGLSGSRRGCTWLMLWPFFVDVVDIVLRVESRNHDLMLAS